jgi:putative methyltransferase (TIGR04325 family)
MSFTIRLELCNGSWRDVQERASRRSQGRGAASLEETRAPSWEEEGHKAILRWAERDGFILPAPEFQFPVIAGILRSALRNGNEINILDFGGSIGSVYFQLKSFVPFGTTIRWNVVELPETVEYGRKHFENNELHFYYNIDECIKNTNPKIILLSGVLQYLEAPDAVLRQCGEIGASTLLIDRTTCSELVEDRLAVQIIASPDRYSEYPLWILSEPRLREELSKHWRFLTGFESAVDGMVVVEDLPVHYRGFLFERD